MLSLSARVAVYWNFRRGCLFTSSLLSLHSLQRVRPVERVALGGDEAGIGDDTAELRFVGAVADAGGVDDIFFDEDAADVVGTELQAHLADFDAGGQPA